MIKSEYQILFEELFIVSSVEEYEVVLCHIEDNTLLSEVEYLELMEMAEDIFIRYVAPTL